MAAEARNNGSGEFEISCAAERVVGAATAAKPPPRYLPYGGQRCTEKS